VRVRITQPLSGSIDGIQLSRFVTGRTYDVGTSLANYLLAQGFAVPVDEDAPALVLPTEDRPERRSAKPDTPSQAKDMPRRRVKKRR
jgi:hypothetical protein